jgi:hypothetical protein
LRKIERRKRKLQFKKVRSNPFPIRCLEEILDWRQEALHGLNGLLALFLGCLAPRAVYRGDLKEC